MKKYEKLEVKTTRDINGFDVSVFLVSRASFNDERLIENRSFSFSVLKDTLFFFDPFFGKKKDSDLEVAFAYLDDENFVILEKRNGKIKAIENEVMFISHIISEDYDDKYIISAHINLRSH